MQYRFAVNFGTLSTDLLPGAEHDGELGVRDAARPEGQVPSAKGQ